MRFCGVEPPNALRTKAEQPWSLCSQELFHDCNRLPRRGRLSSCSLLFLSLLIRQVLLFINDVPFLSLSLFFPPVLPPVRIESAKASSVSPPCRRRAPAATLSCLDKEAATTTSISRYLQSCIKKSKRFPSRSLEKQNKKKKKNNTNNNAAFFFSPLQTIIIFLCFFFLYRFSSRTRNVWQPACIAAPFHACISLRLSRSVLCALLVLAGNSFFFCFLLPFLFLASCLCLGFAFLKRFLLASISTDILVSSLSCVCFFVYLFIYLVLLVVSLFSPLVNSSRVIGNTPKHEHTPFFSPSL